MELNASEDINDIQNQNKVNKQATNLNKTNCGPFRPHKINNTIKYSRGKKIKYRSEFQKQRGAYMDSLGCNCSFRFLCSFPRPIFLQCLLLQKESPPLKKKKLIFLLP